VEAGPGGIFFPNPNVAPGGQRYTLYTVTFVFVVRKCKKQGKIEINVIFFSF
jgi:hypothetical protein